MNFPEIPPGTGLALVVVVVLYVALKVKRFFEWRERINSLGGPPTEFWAGTAKVQLTLHSPRLLSTILVSFAPSFQVQTAADTVIESMVMRPLPVRLVDGIIVQIAQDDGSIPTCPLMWRSPTSCGRGSHSTCLLLYSTPESVLSHYRPHAGLRLRQRCYVVVADRCPHPNLVLFF
jgi:hypothetical protein